MTRQTAVQRAQDELLEAEIGGGPVRLAIARRNLRTAQGWAARHAAMGRPEPLAPAPLDPHDRLGDFLRRHNAR